MKARTDKITSFTYTTYIHARPEQVWRGLTDPAFTKCYWRTALKEKMGHFVARCPG